jgi:hypothetical protein
MALNVKYTDSVEGENIENLFMCAHTFYKFTIYFYHRF